MLDAFHVVKLGSAVLDEVRRRVQQETSGHRGRGGDPHHEVTLAWHCYKKLRAVHHAHPETGPRIVAEVLASLPACPVPEIARLGRTLRRWRAAIEGLLRRRRRPPPLPNQPVTTLRYGEPQ